MLKKLSKEQNKDYKKTALKLYSWLITPIESILTQHNITTLVVVPDRKLRTIPFAALYDGEKFLIQKYAIATLPSLKLTDSTPVTDAKPLSRESLQIFIGGLSKSVIKPDDQYSKPLPSVVKEVKEIKKLYPKNSKTFLNEKLTKSIFKAEMKMESPPAYTMIHIASHSYFTPDPENNYLLLYDGYVTMDSLESLLKSWQFKEHPLQLLTLSACNTAKGDDYKARLGLAGVSIKAGVESTLANLWLVNDRAATELSVAFYEHLQNQKLTKAQALQEAQKELMKKKDFQHPYYWAPLILIGNWR